MSGASGGWLHGRWDRALVLHFARQLGPAREAGLRRHLQGCPRCRAAYAVLALAEGDGASARHDRLEAALFGPAPSERAEQPGWSPLTRLAAVAAPLVLLLALGGLVLWQLDRPAPFVEKGGLSTASRFVSIAVYHRPAAATASERSPQPVPEGGRIRRTDRLAFAYTNRAKEGFDRLLIFGVDEHATIYWFYPEWTDPGTDPAAVPISRGTGVELADEVTHAYEGRRLRIFALFSRRRDLSVRGVERIVAGLKAEKVRVDRLDWFPVDGTGQHTILLEVAEP